MSAPPKNYESDARLTSGPWNGFFIEDHRPERGWMSLYLNFFDNQIAGEGTDYVGPWHIQGKYDLTRQSISWRKNYLNRHHVEYAGKLSDRGIIGQWTIPSSGLSGEFHIWPRSKAEIHGQYLADEQSQQPRTDLWFE